MIILFDKNAKSFNTLGLGVLKDAIRCIVTEELNGGFELEMEYPISGNHYSNISLQKIIVVAPNMYDQPQPFRIYSITKPLNGKVTINAEHISYDMSGYIVKPFEGTDLGNVLSQIQNGAFPNSPFTFTTDKIVSTSMKTDKPYSQRALLAGQAGSLLDIYGGEYKFDRFNISLLNNRGSDRGITIRHGKNLTELEDEKSSEKMYTGIFPFYSAVLNETKTFTEKHYQSVYIVPDSVTFAGNWLSLSDGGKALIPLIENTPVQIKSAGSYLNKIVYFLRAVLNENLFNCYIRSSGTEFSSNWLSLTEGGAALIPVEKTIYKILTEGDFTYKTFIWNGFNYVEFTGTGFYYIYPDGEAPEPILMRTTTSTEERAVYIDLTSDETLVNGIIPVEGQEDADPQKILNLDLTGEFTEEPTEEELKERALKYLNDNDLQKITNTLTISFIKLSDTEEYRYLKDLEIVKLGDYISVIYEKLGVDSKLQVILTEYNVLTEKYNEIELGTKSATLTDTVITTGDGVSSLTNDKNYTDQVSVVNLMATNLTADYITGKNANLTEAQIEQLKTERIEAKGLIEASEAYIDSLMAQLMTAENADVKNKLMAGEIEVRGKIIALSGEILCEIKVGKNEDDTFNFTVDDRGNVAANSVEITGGVIKLGKTPLNNYKFQVDNEGNIFGTSFNYSQIGTVADKDEEGEDVDVSVLTKIQDGVITASTFLLNHEVSLMAKSVDLQQHGVYFQLSLYLLQRPGVNQPSDVHLVVTPIFYDPETETELPTDSLFYNTNMTVITQEYSQIGDPIERIHNIVIPAGTSTSSPYDIIIGEMPLWWHNIWIVSYNPITTIEQTGGNNALTLNSDFLPRPGFTSMSHDIGSLNNKWHGIFLEISPSVSSDKKAKFDISYDLSKYEKLFDGLKPSVFKLKKDTYNCIHAGFIAQDVEKTILESNLKLEDLACLTKGIKDKSKNKSESELNDEDYIYSLKYEELHALEIHEIQKLKKELRELKDIIKGGSMHGD